MARPTVRSLHIYPIKGARAVDLQRAAVEPRGLVGDRRWLVVDAQNRFLTQRSHPLLARLTARTTGAGLELSAEGAPSVAAQIPDGSVRARVTIWCDAVDAALAAADANDWLSDLLKERVRLVYMDGRAERLTGGGFETERSAMSFGDAYPILVTTTGSLAALNEAIGLGVRAPMARFRPNIVVDCDEAWAEDYWRTIGIGDLLLDLVKPSDRCAVTTIDQKSGASMGKEPLKTLARLRRSADPRVTGVLFGWNAISRCKGAIDAGAEVRIVERRAEGWSLARDEAVEG